MSASMSGTVLGASADVLQIILSVFFLAPPFILAIPMALRRGRHFGWAALTGIAGAGAFVGGKVLFAADDLGIPVLMVVLAPLALGVAASFAVLAALARLPIIDPARTWRGAGRIGDDYHDVVWSAADGRALSITDPSGAPLAHVAPVHAVRSDAAAVIVEGLDQTGAPTRLALSPAPENDGPPAEVRAAAIARKLRRQLALPDPPG